MGSTVFPAPASGLDITKLTLRQTITSTGAVTLPVGVMQVYAVVIGGGGGGGTATATGCGGGGGAGGVSAGWVFPAAYAIIGAGGNAGANGGVSKYGAQIAGGGAPGANGSSAYPMNPDSLSVSDTPWYLGTAPSNAFNVIAGNGSAGGAGSGTAAQSAYASTRGNSYDGSASPTQKLPYEATLGGVYAPIGAGQRGSATGGVTGQTNGLSGSGGSAEPNSTVTGSTGNGGPGYFCGGGGAANATGGANALFSPGVGSTRASAAGGGGGAGAAGNGSNNSGLTGGAGGAGGGGGGGGGYSSGTGGVGGSGAVLIYY